MANGKYPWEIEGGGFWSKQRREEYMQRCCKGKNCGSTDGVSHSEECYAEHEKTISCGGTWMPIATASKDGTHILVCDVAVNWLPPTSVHWYIGEDESKENGWHLSVNPLGEFSAYRYNPTHWMPCPELPSRYLLDGEREHVESVDCWCKPYQDEQSPNVWIHNALPTGRA